MRIISQDKMTDTPYDNAVVYINRQTPTQIYVGGVDSDDGFPIGTFDTEEDALMVMRCIRLARNLDYKYFHMPTAEEMKDGNPEMFEGER